MNIKWTLRTAPRTAGFLLKQRIHSFLDRKVTGRRRDEAVLAFVQQRARQGDPTSVLATMDAFSVGHRWLMNIGPEKGRILVTALEQAAARNVLELGAYCGYSATLIGRYLASCGGRLTSIEINSRHVEVARQIIEHAGLSAHVQFRKGTLSSEFDALQGPFDGVLLDHWKDEYLPDLKRLEEHRLIRPGTVVIADNVGFFSVPDYLEYVRTSGRYQTRFEEASVEYNEKLRDGVEVSVFLGSG
jgi:catechol O-methyltransferase